MKSMTNFLVVINAWYSKKLVTGGEYHMIQVLKYWSKQHCLAIVTPKLAYQTTKSFIPNVNLFHFSSNEGGEEIKGLARLVIAYLVRIIKSIFVKPKVKPDVIITASHFLYDVLPGIFLRKRFNSKLLVYSHGTLGNLRIDKTDLRSNIMLLNEKLSLFFCKRWADRIFAISNETKNYLIYHGVEPSRITSIRNGVDHDFINSIQQTEKKYKACFCGRLVKRKGVYDLLGIWEIVLRHFADGVLVIIGQGQEYDGLKRAISINGLENKVVLTGYVPDDEKITLMKASEIFIFPSYEEAWGIALYEAMACGVPVVCYDLPAYDIIKNGIIKSNLGNKEHLAKQLITLLGDQKRKKYMANQAVNEAKKFDWKEIAREELNLVHWTLSQ
jgi:glycosyltransferase involved in cell wall biosynthesis